MAKTYLRKKNIAQQPIPQVEFGKTRSQVLGTRKEPTLSRCVCVC